MSHTDAPAGDDILARFRSWQLFLPWSYFCGVRLKQARQKSGLLAFCKALPGAQTAVAYIDSHVDGLRINRPQAGLASNCGLAGEQCGGQASVRQVNDPVLQR